MLEEPWGGTEGLTLMGVQAGEGQPPARFALLGGLPKRALSDV